MLDVTDLRVELPGNKVVVDRVSFTVAAGEAIGLVGESGAGKSLTLKGLMGLVPVTGSVRFDGREVLTMAPRAVRAYRSRDVALIHQDSRMAINPVRTVGAFLTEGGRATPAQAVQVLKDVGVEGRRMRQYPHELSGGLLQRVMIAAALLSGARLLLADEPTTALDVTTQQEVMALLDGLRRSRGLAMVFVTHDLDLAAAVTDRIAVMYAGTIVENAPAAALHGTLGHPYPAALLRSRPIVGSRDRLAVLPGRPIAAYEAGAGCVFVARCPLAQHRCHEERPAVRPYGEHQVACHRAGETP